MNNRIALSDFVQRQTPSSGFSHWTMPNEALVALVEAHFDEAQQGYRDGVLLVPVPPEGFFSNTVQMKENDILIGMYMPRKAGEEPRRHVYVLGAAKIPANRVDVVLYRHDVLQEGNEASCDAEWEIISVNAEVMDNGSPSPMKPGTLMSNHYNASGGTRTLWANEEFEEALRLSFGYWKDKGDACPEPFVPHFEGNHDDKSDMLLYVATNNLNDAVTDLLVAAKKYQALIAERAKQS